MDKVHKKIEEYLKKQFPKKKIVQAPNGNVLTWEVYGFMSMVIYVKENAHTVYYHLMKKK